MDEGSSAIDAEIIRIEIPQLGVSAIFLYSTWRLYTDNQAKIAEKDEYIKILHEALQSLYIRNTEILTQLRDNINANTKSIEANTEALHSLESKV